MRSLRLQPQFSVLQEANDLEAGAHRQRIRRLANGKREKQVMRYSQRRGLFGGDKTKEASLRGGGPVDAVFPRQLLKAVPVRQPSTDLPSGLLFLHEDPGDLSFAVHAGHAEVALNLRRGNLNGGPQMFPTIQISEMTPPANGCT